MELDANPLPVPCEMELDGSVLSAPCEMELDGNVLLAPCDMELDSDSGDTVSMNPRPRVHGHMLMYSMEFAASWANVLCARLPDHCREYMETRQLDEMCWL
eukprot:3990341-Karenia_brevis.AAC.1